MFGSDVGLQDAGIVVADPQLREDENGLWRPIEGSPAIDMAIGDYAWVENDIDGDERTDAMRDIGADERTSASLVRKPLTPDDVGPDWVPGVLTSVGSRALIPDDPGLHNYPNPVKEKTTISFNLNKPSRVVLTIYNSIGQELEGVLDTVMSQGAHDLTFHKGNWAPGIYFYVLEVDSHTFRNSMVVI